MRIAAFIFSSLLAGTTGCTTYNENGELVRHHFGYVRVVTPAVYAPQGPVQAVIVSNFGLWLDIDRRKNDQKYGSGAGIGYRKDEQNILPTDCRIVFRVKTMEQFEASVALVNKLGEDRKVGEDLCVIRED